MSKQVMTLNEVATYLQLSVKTVSKMVNNGEIPCAKIANQWRFDRTLIEDWLLSKMQVIPQNDLSRLIEKEYDMVPLSRLLHTDTIILGSKAAGKEELLSELADTALSHHLVSDRKVFLDKLLEREEMISTGIGNGIALPHLRKPSPDIVNEPRIVILTHPAGVDFGALDNRPTHVFFLILSDSEMVHCRILARLTDFLRQSNPLNALKKAKSAGDVIDFFIRFEQQNLKESLMSHKE